MTSRKISKDEISAWEEKESERDFKGAWIPKTVLLCRDLSPVEMLLLVDIDSYKECFVSNRKYAIKFDVSISRISHIISSLKDRGYLDVTLTYKKDSKQVEKRILSIGDTYRDLLISAYKNKEKPSRGGVAKNNHRGVAKNNHTCSQKQLQGVAKNSEDRDTSLEIPITKESNKHIGANACDVVSQPKKSKPRVSQKSKVIPKPADVDKQVWQDWIDMRKQLKASVSQTVMTRISNQAAKAGISLNETLCIMLERNWKGFQAEWVAGNTGNVVALNSTKTIPDDFALTREREQLCSQLAPELINDVGNIFNRFVANARSNGRSKADWGAAWAEWLTREIDTHRNQKDKQKTFKQKDLEYQQRMRIANADSSWAEDLAL